MNKIFSYILMTLVFASCQNSGNRKIMDPVPSGPIMPITPPAPITDSNKQVTVTNTPAPATSATPPTKTTTTSVGKIVLNPEHGAPGHRCDIKVGTPLNSPASNTPASAKISNPAPIKSQTPAPAQTQAPPQPVDKNVRLNPAHGAPGHDCSIVVGQPLKK